MAENTGRVGRFDRGFRFPLQKYSDEKALYTNFRYLQEYLNYINRFDQYGPTIIVAASNSVEIDRANYVCDGVNDQIQIQAAADELSSTGGEIALLEGTYNLADEVTLSPAVDIAVRGIGMPTLDCTAGAFVGTLSGGVGGMKVFENLSFTGGASEARIVQAGSRMIVKSCKFVSITARACVGTATGAGTVHFIVTDCFFHTITPAGGTGASPHGVIYQDHNNTKRGIVIGNIFNNISVPNGNAAVIEFAGGSSGIFATSNRFESITGNIFGSGTHGVHNTVENVPTAGNHDDLTLDNLGDVIITAPADNEVLTFDLASGDWINQTAAEAALAAAVHTHTESQITDLDHTDVDAIHDNVAGEISALTQKVTPVAADHLLIEDSEALNVKKRITVESVAETVALGTLGYAEVTADQAVALGNTDALTGLSVTVDVGTSRRIKITAQLIVSPGGAGVAVVKIIEDLATDVNLNRAQMDFSAANDEHTLIGHAIETPSAGSHTYFLDMTAVNAGMTMLADPEFPAFILVEDIGPA